jgi:uroporphyrinogen decarboxylase
VHHQAVPEINRLLAQRLGVSSPEDLLGAIGCDLRFVWPTYKGPELRRFSDGTYEGLWGERYSDEHNSSGVFQDVVYLPHKAISTISDLDELPNPSPDWFDYSDVQERCRSVREFAVAINGPGTLDFLNGIGRTRGQEQVLVDVATENPVFLELVERRFAFYYAVTERMLQAADGLVDIVWAGEDLGSQQGLLISPQSFDRLFADKYRAFFALAHEYGARTALHCCGAIRPMIPRLIELGCDILDVVQVSANGMDLAGLKHDFGDRLTFCGTMCVQTLLTEGTPDLIRREVEARLELFRDGGLILGPTNTIEIGTPIENVLAMYEAAGSLDCRRYRRQSSAGSGANPSQ